jgi:hypothetical protein
MANPVEVIGGGFSVGASFTRPGDTTAYTSGDLIANSTTNTSVVPLSFVNITPTPGLPFAVIGARFKKSTTSLTTASVRLHLFHTFPTAAVGDNAAFDSAGALGVDTTNGYIGYIDATFDVSATAGASARGVPTSPGSSSIVAVSLTGGLWGLLEARSAYTPGNAEVITVSVEGFR